MTRDPEVLTQAAMAQQACGWAALPDGTRVLELPKVFYFRRNYITQAGFSVSQTDVGYQVFDPEFPFVLRSIQYQATPGSTPCPINLRFSNGRVLPLPVEMSHGMDGAGATCRLDVSGTASKDSAGGIVLPACDRVTVETVLAHSGGYGGGWQVNASIAFIGVLRVPFKSSEAQPAYSAPLGGPRALWTSNQNLFAPETMRGFQCGPEIPPGLKDEVFWIVTDPVTVTLAAGISNVATGQVLIPGTADFVWREWDFLVPFVSRGVASAPVKIAVRFRTMNGEYLSDDVVDCQSCQGPVFPELRLPRGSYVYYDVTVSNPAGVGTVQVVFVLFGVRRVRA